MITRAQIQHIRSLQQGKFREEYGEFIAEGCKLMDELLHSAYTPVCLCAVHEWWKEKGEQIPPGDYERIEVTPAELERISALSTPNRVLGVFKKPAAPAPPGVRPDELVLVLDELRDPGNLGTLVRIADWFGIDKLVCSPSTVDLYNPKTVQSTMGSLTRVSVSYCDLISWLDTLDPACRAYATTLDGKDLNTLSLPQGGLILIGSESHGLSEALIQRAHQKVTIPRFAHEATVTGQVESLNASVSAAILCAAFRRR